MLSLVAEIFDSGQRNGVATRLASRYSEPMSRFSELLASEKIDPRRLLVASAAIERLRPEDRRAHFLKRKKKGGAAAEKPAEGEAPPAKPRSGVLVSSEVLRKAQEGLPLTGPQKTRVLRALNRVLEQKKKEPVDLRKVF